MPLFSGYVPYYFIATFDYLNLFFAHLGRLGILSMAPLSSCISRMRSGMMVFASLMTAFSKAILRCSADIVFSPSCRCFRLTGFRAVLTENCSVGLLHFLSVVQVFEALFTVVPVLRAY